MNGCNNDGSSVDSALGYRLGGLFGILVAGIVGFALTTFSNGRMKTLAFFFRTFSAGVVLAVGIVHILPDAASTMSNPCLHLSTEYPWAFVIALFAALFTFAGELSLRKFMFAAIAGRHEAARIRTEDVEGEIKFTEEERQELIIQNFRVVAYTLEAGIIFHSVFVGISLGTSHDAKYVQGLAFALLFHQGFEGLSLGGALSKAKLPALKVLLLGAAFALTTPFGIGIGIAVGSSYEENSEMALGFEGSFNSVSAGILIYNGLVDLMVPAFDEQDEATPKNPLISFFGFCSMLFGAGAMSFIAKWA